MAAAGAGARVALSAEFFPVRYIRRFTIFVEPDMRTPATLLRLALVWFGVSLALGADAMGISA